MQGGITRFKAEHNQRAKSAWLSAYFNRIKAEALAGALDPFLLSLDETEELDNSIDHSPDMSADEALDQWFDLLSSLNKKPE